MSDIKYYEYTFIVLHEYNNGRLVTMYTDTYGILPRTIKKCKCNITTKGFCQVEDFDEGEHYRVTRDDLSTDEYKVIHDIFITEIYF